MSEFIHFFPGQGFRPAVWAKDYIGPKIECILPVPTPDADVAMIGKFDPFAHIQSDGYAWGTWIPAQIIGRETGSEVDKTVSVQSPPSAAVWHPSTPSQPWWPSEPNQPEWPCCIVQEPETPLPPVAPIPLPASAALLLVAVAALALWRRAK